MLDRNDVFHEEANGNVDLKTHCLQIQCSVFSCISDKLLWLDLSVFDAG